MIFTAHEQPLPYAIPMEENCHPQPVQRINGKSLKSHELKLEWIPCTTGHVTVYAVVAIIMLLYNSACFIHNFGRMPLEKQSVFDEILGEEALIYSVFLQWFMVFSIFLSGIILDRCVPQPLHIFLSILATNANAVLFAINVRKVADDVIPVESQYFFFVTALFVISIVLCVAYLVALGYYRKEKRYYRAVTLSATALQQRTQCLAELEAEKYYIHWPNGIINPASFSPTAS